MKIRSLKERWLNPLAQDEDRLPGTLHKDFLGSGDEYLFKPEYEGGPHVCEVENRDHIKRFLSLTDDYELADDDEDPEEVAILEDEIEEEAADAEQRRVEQEDSKWPNIMDIDHADHENWQTKRLIKWAADVLGVNGKSPKEIREYAESEYGIVLPVKTRSPGTLLRAFIEARQEQKRKESEVAESSDDDVDLEGIDDIEGTED